MLKVKIRQAAEKRKIYSPAELARRVGVKEAVAGRWWKWESQNDPIPTLKSLDAICAAFGNCKLGELVERVPDGDLVVRVNGKKRGKR